MDLLSAFLRGEVNRGKEPKVFDWDRAARRIRETAPAEAAAGLAEDWFFTGGNIFEKGAPVEEASCYLASTWATPVLKLDGESEPCFRMQQEVPEWDAETIWPENARNLLKGDE